MVLFYHSEFRHIDYHDLWHEKISFI